jgi:hypothetical protein
MLYEVQERGNNEESGSFIISRPTSEQSTKHPLHF